MGAYLPPKAIRTVKDVTLLPRDIAADRIGVSEATLTRWISDGSGPAATVLGRRCYVAEETLARWLRAGRPCVSYLTRISGVPDSGDIVAGMAHYPGSGPVGSVCYTCKYLGRANKRGMARCAMFKQLTGQPGAAFSGSTRSCQHYQARPAK